jgi:hypothetical protein
MTVNHCSLVGLIIVQLSQYVVLRTTVSIELAELLLLLFDRVLRVLFGWKGGQRVRGFRDMLLAGSYYRWTTLTRR